MAPATLKLPLPDSIVNLIHSDGGDPDDEEEPDEVPLNWRRLISQVEVTSPQEEGM